MKILLLFALFGLAYGNVGIYLIKYKYEGRVANGVPELRHQYAGTGIRFEVHVAMDMMHKLAFMSFKDIEVGEFNGDVGSNGRAPMDIPYNKIESHFSKQLGIQFAVDFNEEEPNILLSKDEPSWLTNIRKSVVNHISIAPVIGSMKKENSMIPSIDTPSYSLYEPTIYGECSSRYTIRKLTDKESEEELGSIHKNMQATSKSLPLPISGDNWLVIRDIDFDNCTDLVELKKSYLSNIEDTLAGHSGSYSFRSSQGRYIVGGARNDLTLIKFNGEDRHKLNPYGFQTETIQTISNQTISLLSVIVKGEELKEEIPKITVANMKFEFNSPYLVPKQDAKDWVKYQNMPDTEPFMIWTALTGIQIPQDRVFFFIEAVANKLQEAVDILKSPPGVNSETFSPFNSPTGKVNPLLLQVSELLAAMTPQQIEDTYKEIKQHPNFSELHHSLFVDALATSGTRHAVRALMMMMERKQLSPARTASILMTLPNNIMDSSVIEPIFEYIKTINMDDHPALASAGYLCLATIARRTCVDPMLRNNSVPSALFGTKKCSLVEERIYPFFERELKSADKPWKICLLTQVIGNLGTRRGYELIKNIAMTYKNYPVSVRNTAIYNMAHKNLHYHKGVREDAMEFLLRIYEDKNVLGNIREAAIPVLFSWSPPYHIWNRIAVSTLTEKNINVLSLVTSVIQNVADAKISTFGPLNQQSQFAAAAAKSMRKSRFSFRHSYSLTGSSYDPHLEVLSLMNAAWLKNKVTDEYFFALNQQLSGLFTNIMEIAVSKSLNSEKIAKPATTLGQAVSNYLIPKLGTDGHMYMRFFNNIYNLIPYDIEDKSINFIEYLVQEFEVMFLLPSQSPSGDDVGKYINPISNTGVIPSAIGLPIKLKVGMSMMFYGNNAMRLIRDKAHPRTINIEIDPNIKSACKFYARSEVMVPWSSQRLVAASDNEKVINIPLRGVFHIDYDEKLKILATLTPLEKKKMNIFHNHNMALTTVKGMLPVKSLGLNSDLWKIIFVRENKTPIFSYGHSGLSEANGLAYDYSWKGDTDTPYKLSMFYKMLGDIGGFWTSLFGSPSLRPYQNNFNIDFSKSETDRLNLDISIFNPVPPDPYLRRSSKPITPPPSFIKELEDNALVKADRTGKLLKDIRKLVARYSMPFGAKMNAVFDGQKRITHESQLMFGEVFSTSYLRNAYQFMYCIFEGNVKTPYGMTIEMDTESPSLNVQQFLSSSSTEKMKKHFAGVIGLYYGHSIEPDRISILGDIGISEDRLKRLQRDMKGEDIELDKFIPGLPTPLTYDKAHIDTKFTKNFKSRQFLNATMVADRFVESIYFPKVSSRKLEGREQNLKNVVSMDATKYLGEERWKAFIRHETRETLYDDVMVPEILSGILQFGEAQFDKDCDKQ